MTKQGDNTSEEGRNLGDAEAVETTEQMTPLSPESSPAPQASLGEPNEATIDRGRFDTTETAVFATPSSDYTYDASSVEEKKVGFFKGILTLRFMEARWIRDLGLLLLRLATLPLMLYGIHWIGDVNTFAGVVGKSAFGQLAPTLFAWLTVLGYLILPVIISLGLFTRWAGFVLAVMFSLIIITVDIPNKGILGGNFNSLTFESAYLYFLLGLSAFLLGAGRLSLDNILGGIHRANR